MPKKTEQALLPPGSKEQPDYAAYEQKMTWRLRWFFAIVLATGYLASLVAAILGFVLTHNPSFLILAGAPSVLLPAIVYLVPMDERRYQLKLRQIEVRAEKARRQLEAKQMKH